MSTWCRATRVTVAATVAWLAFVCLQHLLTGRWWLWLLPDLLPPLTFLLVPVLLAAVLPAARLLRRRVPTGAARVVLAGAVVAAALGWPYNGIGGIGGVSVANAADGTGPGLRVFAWNTGYWGQDVPRDRFYAFLRAQDADVYLLQEYLHWDETAGLDGARQVDDEAALRAAFPGYAIASRGELLTLSRRPIVATPPVGPDRDLAGRAAGFDEVFATAKVLRTDLEVGGQVVSAYNVHLPVQIDLAVSARFFALIHERDGARRRQLAGLRADLAGNAHPAIVAGDFNTSPAMGDLAVLRDTLHDASTALYPGSWPAGLPLWRIDWTFTTAGLAADGYRLVGTDGLSDHRAQRVRIALKGHQ
ncbi:endonuclease/exonuclease/phosphatase family protein [Dactylosporangium aurantiacum]|uniref:Endonuclease/exonuclease/phosphatase family protein n=1 Tax=Dactylosporangium aurantiacum TaxID=35754 RepID=A0A9Q9IQN8_9ACTN|nr:endonuclease/exonuclease/phosphatase family protein [Dactylosporangium aurantiacum]MDG6106282.1 endonuclease/exonuclease/phosphatase family protein [Dactylosporangium aurantiacum]UWZ58220.1 endonuclease/exonuclease/phosphatase family protein [Dactylosporangium aurantiacum]